MPAPTPHSTPHPDLRSALAHQSRKKRGYVIALSVIVLAVIGLSAMLLSAARSSSTGGERLSVRIATAEDNPYFDAVATAAAERGLDIEWVNVNDWVLPNTELVAGSVDANAFQHVQYLSLFNTENNADLVPAFSTIISQWGIFSSKHTSLAELPAGARIAIPDDLSNAARALFVLQAAGVIEVDPAAGLAPTVTDVTSNPKNLEFVELAALSIPQQYEDPSIDAVVIGTSYFDPAAGIFTEDALFADNPSAEQNLPYVNILTVRADDIQNQAWSILREAYADPRVAEALNVETFGNQVLVDVPVEKLTESLTELESFAASTK